MRSLHSLRQEQFAKGSNLLLFILVIYLSVTGFIESVTVKGVLLDDLYLLFAGLITYWISHTLFKAEKYSVISFTAILVLTVLALLAMVAFGIALPFACIALCLAIACVSSLFGPLATLVYSFQVMLGILAVHTAHHFELITISRVWSNTETNIFDILFIIFLMSLLSSHLSRVSKTTGKSLAEVQRLNSALEIERDQLEIKVLKRTKELETLHAKRAYELHQLAELGQYTAGLIHDISNPLTTLSLSIANPEQTSGSIQQAELAVQKITSIVQAGQKQVKLPSKQRFQPSREITSALELLKYKIRLHQIRISIDVDANIFITADPTDFFRICSNLLSNAVDSLSKSNKPERRIVISLYSTDTEAILSISDNGPGISDADLPKVFQPFFSTKMAENTGLGLAITKTLTENNGGQIKVSNIEGATFTLSFAQSASSQELSQVSGEALVLSTT